ncbi:hypothetical protein [Effusibacillus consociatus]|uniref:HK97 gp10 family phage protein n=1 Tax=Effusibacillus consociatus TaxID=1117041 RepID=A0ABV9Q378_9BACL
MVTKARAPIDLEIRPDAGTLRLLRQHKELAPRAIKMGLDAVVTEAVGEVKKTITDIELIDKGRLRASIMGEISPDGKKGIIGSDVKYAAIHEYGGVIKPKRAKMLAFQVQSGSQIVGKSGKRLKNPKKISKWVFAKKVTIKEKRYMRGTIERMQSSGKIESLFAAGVRQAIEKF